MDDYVHLIVASGLIIVVYAVVANRMMKVGNVLRRRALQTGHVLLADPHVPEPVKAQICEITQYLTRARAAWAVVAAFPLAVMRSKSKPKLAHSLPIELQPLFRDHQGYVLMSMLSNSPAAFALFACEFLVISYFAGINKLMDVVLRSVLVQLKERPHPHGHEPHGMSA